MTKPPPRHSSWNELASIWQSSADAIEDALIVRTRGARQAARRIDGAAAALTVVGIAGVLAAMSHAADAVERILGSLAIAGLVTAWVAHVRGVRAARRAASEPSDDFVRERAETRRRQIRFARFTWVVVLCALVFLAPWWIGGVRAHGVAPAGLMLAGFWIPVAVIVGCVVWTIRLARGARAELDALERIIEPRRDS